jgi:hypothetical protein
MSVLKGYTLDADGRLGARSPDWQSPEVIAEDWGSGEGWEPYVH